MTVQLKLENSRFAIVQDSGLSFDGRSQAFAGKRNISRIFIFLHCWLIIVHWKGMNFQVDLKCVGNAKNFKISGAFLMTSRHTCLIQNSPPPVNKFTTLCVINSPRLWSQSKFSVSKLIFRSSQHPYSEKLTTPILWNSPHLEYLPLKAKFTIIGYFRVFLLSIYMGLV